MALSYQDMKDELLVNEGVLLNQILNLLLIILSGLGMLAIVIVLYRTTSIGWGIKDLIQIVVFTAICSVTLGRKRFATTFKVYFLIGSLFLIGLTGIFSLGLFGGAVFFLPLAVMLASLFHSSTFIIRFALITMLAISMASLGFITGVLEVNNANELLRNPVNWAVYVICFLILITFSGTAIYKYRCALLSLIEKISNQRDELIQHNQSLEQAMAEIKTLQGIIPICSYCKNIRSDSGAWGKIEEYIATHSDAKLNHGACPSCSEKLLAELDKFEGKKAK